ncbi:TIGR02680 family protein [Streptomyces sp. NPDC001840]
MRAVRWRPSRAGVLNVWRYYDEVFTFHRGRLLLRGPNGTGKSKALEVLLPFLFDASLKPNRLSTFGGSERTMHWNLMGEGATGVTRVGYVWLEFRADGDGDAGGDWFTIGARLQATSRTTSVGVDFFTARCRVGHGDGLVLTTETGQPLPVAALKQALAGRGDVHDTAADYRAAVRQKLFPGMSEQRYEALITALLQLRTPKLSERLDPSLLSALLSRALPPLDRDEISELADGFERLDRQREELARMDDRVEAAGKLAARQRTYTQRVLRARAAELISATTEMDNLARSARAIEEAYERAVSDQEGNEEYLAETEHLAEELRSRIEVSTNSEEYRQGRELDRLRRQTGQARADAEARRGVADTAHAEGQEEAALAALAQGEAESLREEARAAEEETWHAARSARLNAVCTEVAAALKAGEDNQAGQLARGAVRGRLGQIAEVREAVAHHQGAVRERTSAEEILDRARASLTEAVARREGRAEAYALAVRTQADRLVAWARDCVQLRLDAEAVEELAAEAAYESEVRTIIEAAARSVEQEVTAAETVIAQRRRTLVEERTGTAAEVARLAERADLPPEPPRTRTGDRGTLPGAPLWRLVAFRDTVPAGEQAGVEAALEASGLLDAWVAPYDGLMAAGHDTFAEPDWPSASPTIPHGRSLARILRPEKDSPVPADRITRLLSAIAYDETLPAGSPAAIGADGTWRLAAATGSWSKPESAHIGASAREHARRRRIDELAAAIADLDARVRSCDTELAGLIGRRQALDLERRNRPDYKDVVDAERALGRADADAASRDDAVRAAGAALSDRESEARATLRALDSLAAEHSLPTDESSLSVLADRAETTREAAGQWVLASVRLEAGLRTASGAKKRADRARRTAEARESEAGIAESLSRSLTAALEEVERTAGASYQEVLRRIAELRSDVLGAEQSIRDLNRVLRDLASRIGSLAGKRVAAAEGRDMAIGARDMAVERLRRSLALGFAEDAGADDIRLVRDAGVTATLEVARAIAARWPSVPHSNKNIATAYDNLAETRYDTAGVLSERADVHLEAEDGAHVLTATLDGTPTGAAGLLAALTDERDRGRDDITSGERGLFDRILTGDTRRHLASRIREANELVDAMNARLERVRTASRVAVQLVWQIDPGLPPGTKAARDLLLKDAVRLTDADHEALHQFFRDRIEEARTSQRAGSWEEQLAQVLDYTAWHQFVVRLDRANGRGWRLLTKKLHGALSGGEKAIALHLPLFAAVAAHYHTVPEAPRLILLDEVFVGVDTTNRGQVFDLLCSLDLDLLLTSDHEWCTYRELDGIAVHQLITDGDDDAVTTARFVWDGVGLVPDETGDGDGMDETREVDL